MYEYDAYWTDLHAAKRASLSAVGWPELGEGFNRGSYRLRLGAAERILRRSVGVPIDSVLEGAVGVGAYAPLWRQLEVRRWVGVDISAVAAADLAERFPSHRFLTADLTDPGLGDRLECETFSLVTAVDVLFHLVDDAAFCRAVENLGNRVAPEGALLLSGVFCEVPRQSAPHVKQRPLDAYADLLAERGLRLAAREPVFAILDEPLPRLGRPLPDRALLTAWHLLSGPLRLAPARFRDAAGASLVRLVAPLDRALRERSVATGVNLEYALFQRAS